MKENNLFQDSGFFKLWLHEMTLNFSVLYVVFWQDISIEELREELPSQQPRYPCLNKV